jgi:ABC-type bacteriocin/lantibiotic exporter with double-glycine peptidase domain
MWSGSAGARRPFSAGAIAIVLIASVAWFVNRAGDPAGDPVGPDDPNLPAGLSCGPAALMVVADAHDAERASRLAAILQRDGLATSPVSSLYDLAASARRAGFDPVGLKVTARQLRELPLPAVVHVKPEHFLALMDVAGDRVVVGDQGALTRTIPRRDFDARFSGYVLCFNTRHLLERPG